MQLLLQLSKAGHDWVGPAVAVGRGVGAEERGAMLSVKEDGVKDVFGKPVGTKDGVEDGTTVGAREGVGEDELDAKHGNALQAPKHKE